MDSRPINICNPPPRDVISKEYGPSDTGPCDAIAIKPPKLIDDYLILFGDASNPPPDSNLAPSFQWHYIMGVCGL